jgi:outer membrane immunogenic protein
MKRLFLGSVALVALSLGTSAAFAADRRVPAYTPPPPPAPVYTWSGCYAGASAGTSTGRVSSTYGDVNRTLFPAGVPGASATNDFNLSGFIGGAQLGCNYQVGAWVWGIEGDWSATNKDGQATELAAPAFQYQITERWLATARGRLGLAGWWGDKTLIYVTGGGAWAKVTANNYPLAATVRPAAIEDGTMTGWTVGGGLEYALGYGWSVKGEYLYVQFDDKTFLGPTNPVALAAFNTKLNDHIWRAGMNYKFW